VKPKRRLAVQAYSTSWSVSANLAPSRFSVSGYRKKQYEANGTASRMTAAQDVAHRHTPLLAENVEEANSSAAMSCVGCYTKTLWDWQSEAQFFEPCRIVSQPNTASARRTPLPPIRRRRPFRPSPISPVSVSTSTIVRTIGPNDNRCVPEWRFERTVTVVARMSRIFTIVQ
jgi:hypothetical protein